MGFPGRQHVGMAGTPFPGKEGYCRSRDPLNATGLWQKDLCRENKNRSGKHEERNKAKKIRHGSVRNLSAMEVQGGRILTQ